MKTHRTDGLSLTFAIVFCGIVVLWLLTTVADVGLPKAGWLVAGALIVFGALGLIGTLRTGRQPGAEQPDEKSSAPVGAFEDDDG